MHEWALAEAVVETVVARSRETGRKRFSYIKIVLGELQQIDRDILGYTLNELLEVAKKELNIEVDKVLFETEKAVARCNRCGFEWPISLEGLGEEIRESIHFLPEAVHSFVKCPSCGSHDFEIVSGRGIAVEVG